MNWNRSILCGLAVLIVAPEANAGRRTHPASRSCQPVVTSCYNPCGYSCGRMLSYTEALARAEDANRAEAALEESQTALTETQAQLAALQAELDSTRETLIAAQGERDQLAMQLEETRQELAQTKQRANNLKQKVDEGADKLAAESGAREKAERQAVKSAEALTAAQLELQVSQAQLKRTADELATLRAQQAYDPPANPESAPEPASPAIKNDAPVIKEGDDSASDEEATPSATEE